MAKIYLKKYTSNDIYMSPAGTVMDATAVQKEFPAAMSFSFVVQTDASGQMMYGMYNLAAMKSQYDIDMSLDEASSITALAEAMNAEQEAQAAAQGEATAEERIAAALEYQVMASLPDEEEE
jgi:hypothetical protein